MSAVRNSTISSLQSEAAAAIAAGNAAMALSLYRSAARLEPKNPMHSLRAGDCLVRLGRTHEALPVYRLVAERYAADGQNARAVSAYRLVQRLAPGDAAAARRIAELKALREKPEAPKAPETSEANAAALAAMFPVIELDVPISDAPASHVPVSDPEPIRISTELCSLWDEESLASVSPQAPVADTVSALEATVRNLLSELLRIQGELDAIKARAASSEPEPVLTH